MKAKKRVQKIKLKKVLKKRDSEDLRILKILQRENRIKTQNYRVGFSGEKQRRVPQESDDVNSLKEALYQKNSRTQKP